MVGDSQHAIEIADRVWWVGHYLPNDNFQCHVYLIENGDQSILLDPGSRLTFDTTLTKIREVIPLENIRYFIFHHPDPDISACLPELDNLVTRPDAVLVTHWRCSVMLRHYNIRLPFWMIDGHDWLLDAAGRRLRFVFTPYAHFPSTFCTFDEQTGTLFSSDLFGGFTKEFSLFATDENYFEMLRPFHEHYMPSRDILDHAITQLETFPITLIAPQHGSIIPSHLVRTMFEKVRRLDCGLYLLAKKNTDFIRLSMLNRILKDITEAMVLYRDFQDIAMALLAIAQRLIPAETLEFYVKTEDGRALYLAPQNGFRGFITDPPPAVTEIMKLDRKRWLAHTTINYQITQLHHDGDEKSSLLVPLFNPTEGQIHAVVAIHLSQHIENTTDLAEMIEQMTMPLLVSVEREAIYRTMDLERNLCYERSIRDPLTGLFTRLYMNDAMERLLSIHNRDEAAPIAMTMVDIDHFKSINDIYGHGVGDNVLKQVATLLLKVGRAGDFVVRLGGEEFAIFAVGDSARNIDLLAERIRVNIESVDFSVVMPGRTTVTISQGIATYIQTESLSDFIQRADHALYTAKKTGRNRVCAAA